MADAKDPKLTLFELYLATTEKVSDRRAQANTWMLSVNSAIVSLYGYLQADKGAIPSGQKSVWLWAIPLAGAIMCIAWAALLNSYRQLNSAKFSVLAKLEADFPNQPFTLEREIYKVQNRISFSNVERLVPIAFILLYILIVLIAITR